MDHVALGFSGKIGSGKTTISEYVANLLSWPKVSFGDYVREIARQQKTDLSRSALQTIGASLVEQDCEGFCRSVLAKS